jgi:hypothetical protein
MGLASLHQPERIPHNLTVRDSEINNIPAPGEMVGTAAKTCREYSHSATWDNIPMYVCVRTERDTRAVESF